MEKTCARLAYGKALAEYGEKNHKVAVTTADVSSSVRTDIFAKAFPERFFNVGIAEQSLIDVSVGLSLGGMVPFANTFAALFQRAFEQIRTSVCYARTNVKIIAGYAGVSDYKDGPTHHSVCDLSVMRSLPNMTVISPADPAEIKKFVPLIAEFEGRVYFRISRAEIPMIFGDSHKVEIGKGIIVKDGKDVTLIGTGTMLYRCLEASKILAKEKIDARVVNIHTIKPIDTSLITKCAKETGAIITAEEHSIIGGLGSAVAEVLAENNPVPMERIGVKDTFTLTGPDPETIMDNFGMAVSDIVMKAIKTIKRKG